MSLSTARALAATVAATVTGGAVGVALILPVAPAHALGTDRTLFPHTWVTTSTPTTGSCTRLSPSVAPSLSWNTNNVPVTSTVRAAAKTTYSGNSADVIDASVASSATVRATPILASGGRISYAGSASISGTPRLAKSACSMTVEHYIDADGAFTVPVGMWAVFSGSARTTTGASVSMVLYNGPGSGPGLSLSGPNTTGSMTTFLPAGSYQIGGEISTRASSSQAGVAARAFGASASGSITVTFIPGGAASAVAGKGRKYVALGGRSCTTNAVSATITKAGRTKAKKIVLRVNGATKASLKGAKLRRTGARTLPVAAGSAATVSAVITLKSGKKVTATRSYRACR
ncbi:hypothetical protein [Nocardioides sp.]|uniref:hypothetical protein n=1 Tax=Nocardioides sp. TaxID=35761 RepID=UPI002634B09E|nr:hypothetical protein [Nocardioides sp.]